mmetsp:Transcript_109364/g.285113  ORF Transcript_109364/g.285113 Transcript_109364/m.285113 type:complete len:218 (+) Transcript_109364:1376-2029(+)
MQAAPEGHRALVRVYLVVSHQLVVVCCNDHVHILDCLAEALIHVLGLHLQLQNAAVHLVHKQARLHALRQGLAQHGLRLHRAALDAIDDDHGAVGDAECGRDLRGEIHVARGIDEVDQMRLGALAIVIIIFEVQRDSSAFDGHATLLLVCSRVSEACIACRFCRDDTSLANERIRQRRLPVVHVCDDRHGTDGICQVHDVPDLLRCEVRHGCDPEIG